ALEVELLENADGGDVRLVDGGEDFVEARMTSRLRDRGARHFRAVTLPREALGHRVDELWLGMEGWNLEEAAEADQVVGRFIVGQPDADAALLEERFAVAYAIATPLPRKDGAVQKIPSDVL